MQATSAQESQSDKSSTNAEKTENTAGGKPKVYKIGKDVTPPRPLEHADPEYTKAARKAKIQGTVVLKMIVDEQGKPQDVRVTGSLRQDLDQRALDAVRKWSFQPSMKAGHPVAVELEVQINFKLY